MPSHKMRAFARWWKLAQVQIVFRERKCNQRYYRHSDLFIKLYLSDQ